MLVARPTIAVGTAQELVALANVSPGKLTYASPGVGTPPLDGRDGDFLKAGIGALALRYFCRWDQAGVTGDATDVAIDFNNGAAYERFMGRWSRAVGALFLNWVVPPKHDLLVRSRLRHGSLHRTRGPHRSPSGIIATDLGVEQIVTAKHQLGDERVEFQIANAQMLPFPGCYFDVIASALV